MSRSDGHWWLRLAKSISHCASWSAPFAARSVAIRRADMRRSPRSVGPSRIQSKSVRGDTPSAAASWLLLHRRSLINASNMSVGGRFLGCGCFGKRSVTGFGPCHQRQKCRNGCKVGENCRYSKLTGSHVGLRPWSGLWSRPFRISVAVFSAIFHVHTSLRLDLGHAQLASMSQVGFLLGRFVCLLPVFLPLVLDLRQMRSSPFASSGVGFWSRPLLLAMRKRSCLPATFIPSLGRMAASLCGPPRSRSFFRIARCVVLSRSLLARDEVPWRGS